MATVAGNAAWNAVERTVTAVLTLVVVPVQVRLLGIEAYGLLGFVASLQVIFKMLDFGLGPTVMREVAADATSDRSRSRELIQAMTGAYWVLSAAVGLVLIAGAPWLATHWLRADPLPAERVVLAIRLIAVPVMLRWPVAVYEGAIAGAQRLDLVNVIRMAVSVLELGLGLFVIVTWRSMTGYLIWLASVAVVELVGYMAVAARVVAGLSLRPTLSWAPLSRVWRFSLEMNAIAILSLLLLQIDKLVISRRLPIAALGFYTAAYSLAAGLSAIPSIITSALYPAIAGQLELGLSADVQRRCGVATQVLMYIVCGAGCALMFYAGPVFSLWIDPQTALRAALPAAVLAFGFIANAAVSVPYTLAVAAGLTSVPLAVNLAAVLAYLPLMYWMVGRWGIVGAAAAWILLNVYYLFVLVPLIQRRLPMEPARQWFGRHVLPFGATGAVAFGVSRLAATGLSADGAWSVMACLACGGIAYALVGAALLDQSVLGRLRTWRGGRVVIGERPLA